MSFTTNPKKERLTQWALDNSKTKDYVDGFWPQVMFVRGKVASLLARTYEQYRDLVAVVGTHRSKSINCPIFFIDLPKEKVKIWMRYNFYNWNVSVEADMPITCDFLDTFNDDAGYGYCYCEGMEDKKFEPYCKDKRKFTVCIDNDYELYTFFKAMRKFLEIKMED